MTPEETEKALNKIEAIRGKNNTRWMDLVRFVARHHPQWFHRWQKDVREYDRQISELNSKL